MSFNKILFIMFVFIGFQVQAGIYPGYERIGTGQISEVPTPGTERAGLARTLVSQLLVGPAGEDFEVTAPNERVYRRIGKKDLMDYFPRTYHMKIKHKSSHLNGKAPVHLVYVIPGFGTSDAEGISLYLSEILSRAGLLTLISHSPAHPEFVLKSSSYGAPGNQMFDAGDLYKQLKLSIKKLKAAPYGYNIEKVSVVGASLGSMNAALLGMLDMKAQKDGDEEAIGFYRVFSLSPPISNVYGSTAIDTMVARAVPGVDEFDFAEKLEAYIGALDLLFAQFKTNTFEDVGKNSEEAFNSILSGTLSTEELKFLVGFGFAPVVQDTLESWEDRNWDELVAVRYSRSRTMPTKFFTEFLKDYSYYIYKSFKGKPSTADIFSFDERAMPHFVMTEKESLGYILPKLQEDGFDLSHYHLVTWHDDFLLRSNDPDWITTTLSGGSKGSSKVFRNGGGHLGGYYQADFQKYLLDNLQ